MTELQDYLLKLLEEIDSICKENSIEYYLFAGSMLGVERNEGFLPWDDDIDLIMTKENYDKFVQVMENCPYKDRTFEHIEKNNEYPLQFGRYTSLTTTGITRSLAFDNSSAGVWIDIIYVVPAPASTIKLNFIKKWFSVYCEIENQVYVEHTNHYKGFYWRYNFCLILSKLIGKERLIKWFRSVFNSYTEEKSHQYLMYHALFTDYRLFDKKYFEEPIRKKYGKIETNVFLRNREFCRLLYGDSWMQVPLEKNQDTHNIVLDFNLPYKTYMDDYMVFLDKGRLNKIIKKTKPLEFKNYNIIRQEKQIEAEVLGILINEEIKEKIISENIDISVLLENENYPEIISLFQRYLDLQLRDDLLYWNCYVPLEIQFVIPVLKALICYKGEYYNARKILNVISFNKKVLTSDVKILDEIIEICKELSIAIWDKEDFYEGKTIVDKFDKKYQGTFCIDVEFARCLIELKTTGNNNCDYTKTKSKLLDVLNKVSSNGDCMKLLGDIELLEDNIPMANYYYERAKENTRNGLILLEIEKRDRCDG